MIDFKDISFADLLKIVQKRDLKSLPKERPGVFDEARHWMMHPEKEKAWRAAWMVRSWMKKNDSQLRSQISAMIEMLPQIREGYLREVLAILEKLEMSIEQEGHLFSHYVDIWSRKSHISSVRYRAVTQMIKISHKYPELKTEVKELMKPQYLVGISPVIRKSIQKLMSEI